MYVETSMIENGRIMVLNLSIFTLVILFLLSGLTVYRCGIRRTSATSPTVMIEHCLIKNVNRISRTLMSTLSVATVVVAVPYFKIS